MKGWKRFLSRWHNLLGLAIVGCYLLAAIAAPRLSPPDDPDHPNEQFYTFLGGGPGTVEEALAVCDFPEGEPLGGQFFPLVYDPSGRRANSSPRPSA